MTQRQQWLSVERQDMILKRARELAQEEQDKATEAALTKAYEASKRARRLLEELGEI